jgi:hypothetical protein
MKTLIALLLFATTPFADTTEGGCYDNNTVKVEIETEVSHVFNEADVTFTVGDDSATVAGVPSGGGDRISDSGTATIKGVGQFKVDDGDVKFKKAGTTRWKTLGPCKDEDEGIGTLPSTASVSPVFILHVPSVTGVNGPNVQGPPDLDDDPLPAI